MDDILRKGDIYYIQESKTELPIGSEMWPNRPGIIISNDGNNQTSPVVQIVYLTSSYRKKTTPMHVEIQSAGIHSIALCEQIHTVDKSRLDGYMGTISDTEQEQIDKAVCFCLGLDKSNCTTVFKKWENYIKKNQINLKKEQEHFAETQKEQAISILRQEVEFLRKEKQAYKTLAQVNENKFQALLKRFD